ncbi:MAG: hypothetical protein IJ558_08060 [Treponema sp.]|nr:hypothetical protein [Treponema sp.]
MKRSRVGGGVLLKVIAAALLASIAGFGLLGCELELNNEDERAATGGSDTGSGSSAVTQLSQTKWTLEKTSTKYGVFLDLDSTDNATAYNMTVDSIKIDGTEQLSSAVHITTDVYITEYATAADHTDSGIKACAKEVTPGTSSTTIEYIISDITVTGATPYYWGVFNFGFTDIDNSVKYCCRDDMWDNGLTAFAAGYPTGTWPKDGEVTYTAGRNILLDAPYKTGKIKLTLTIDNSNQTATFTVYTVS